MKDIETNNNFADKLMGNRIGREDIYRNKNKTSVKDIRVYRANIQ